MTATTPAPNQGECYGEVGESAFTTSANFSCAETKSLIPLAPASPVGLRATVKSDRGLRAPHCAPATELFFLARKRCLKVVPDLRKPLAGLNDRQPSRAMASA